MKPTAKAAGLAACFLVFVLAWAGAPAPALAQDIQVNSADPSSAPQGTVNLNVTIKGKGFKRGAVARFFVTGTTNPGGITVKSTSFVSPGQLTANIDVALDATLGSFDVEVTNADGRTGKGTELFAVTAAGRAAFEIPVAVTFRDDATDNIQSDGLGAYSHGTDQVRAVIVSNGNLFMKTNDSAGKPALRRLSFDFTEPVSTEYHPPFDTGTQQGYVSISCPSTGALLGMEIGTTQDCGMYVHFAGLPGTSTQWGINFGAYSDTTRATAYRIDQKTWEIEVRAPAVGKLSSAPTKGRLVWTDQGNFHMPVKLLVTVLE